MTTKRTTVKYLTVQHVVSGMTIAVPDAGWNLAQVTGFVRRMNETDLYLDATRTVTLPNNTVITYFD